MVIQAAPPLIPSRNTEVITPPPRWGGSQETAWELGLGVRMCLCTCCTQVVYSVGLCICLFDITKLEDAYVFPGDGASHTKGGSALLLDHWGWGSVFTGGRPGLGVGKPGAWS